MCQGFQDALGKKYFAGVALFYSNTWAKIVTVTKEKAVSPIYKGEMQTD